MRERPNLAERILGRIGFALSIPTMAPVALLVAALTRAQRGGRVARALLTPVLGTTIFIAFIVTIVVFAPYYLLLRVLSWIGLVDLSAPRSFDVSDVSREENFESFSIDFSVPYDDRAGAIATLTRVVVAITGGENVHFLRETFGPFTTSGTQVANRVASFVESLEYGANAKHCWFIAGSLNEDIVFDLTALTDVWNAELASSILDRATMLCHVEMMADQGAYSARVVVCAHDGSAVASRVSPPP